MQTERHAMLTRVCFDRWKRFIATIASTRSSIVLSMNAIIVDNAFIQWKQAASFQAAARDLLADAAVRKRSREQLRSKHTLAVAAIILKEWSRVTAVRLRADALHKLVLYRIASRAFRRWTGMLVRIACIRQLAHRADSSACRKVMIIEYQQSSPHQPQPQPR